MQNQQKRNLKVFSFLFLLFLSWSVVAQSIEITDANLADKVNSELFI